MLNPAYEIPCRQTVSKNLIPRLYNSTLEVLKKKVENANAVSLTTDGWTCINNRSYIAVTAHFINDEGKMCSVCLGCEHFDQRHSSDNIAAHLKKLAIEWKVSNKIVAIVTDNAANITAAVRQLHYRHLGCFAHLVNLIVQHSLENIAVMVAKVKKIVEYFKRSSNALAKLNSTLTRMGLLILKLKQDCVTRWNSTFDMLKRIVFMKDAVISTLAVLQTDIEVLTPVEWDVADKAIDVLQIFNEVTIEVSSEKTVSISKLIVLVSSMSLTMETYVNNIHLPNEVHQMAISLNNQLRKRFSDIEENELIAQASILDPRFKKYEHV
ncbi:E3 SUMO-protein ligase ZBED1-like [Daktulosphaira vitifoliae]|uniref:E3 SUMO-protein ligase ZBED1-like n=1 Tax=Daktulosphaira vitifoliae TaxID=58002 RepID=UPI0021AAB393|nr:E3 SUMO-protein ligase ZBED1-like [Daktulosphaira vitifoliae]